MTGREETPPDWARAAMDAYREALETLYYEVSSYRYPAAPLSDDVRQVFFLPDGAPEWKSLGYANDPIADTVYELVVHGEVPLVTMPCQHDTSLPATVQASIDQGLHALTDAIAAVCERDLDRRLLRLADDLGRWEPHVRLEWHQVQQVLEDAGIADGYGRLTIPQPVRPPIEPPARNGQP
ncbi:hypothetical protein [Streptomyces sp. enrichment culture]|uniref:hypothetical protein n=1 Tax=Streptomyces sp. enrichment culture TaxID=1795815 RepID=UPI003F56BDC4